MRHYLIAFTLSIALLVGCTVTQVQRAPVSVEETAEQAAARVTRHSLDEMALAVTAAYQTIGQRLDDRVWSADQAEEYWNKANEIEQGIGIARSFLGDGDIAGAELQRKAINLILKELQDQLAEGEV